MRKSTKTQRLKAFRRQKGRCFYCDSPMWETSITEFQESHGLTARQARLLTCTREHLVPLSENGSNRSCNIVAACLYCNATRDRRDKPLSPSQYRRLVTKRLRSGRWHFRIFPQLRPAG